MVALSRLRDVPLRLSARVVASPRDGRGGRRCEVLAAHQVDRAAQEFPEVLGCSSQSIKDHALDTPVVQANALSGTCLPRTP